ncbi:hypothetical protein WSM22_46440 [Cytophagales bacterium WSM2-2]|nr:hypothetical protein WSM22_46440 [Cytophagales bacterium WSM2-2]
MAHPGVSIVMDKKGSVYYSDLKQVWKIDTQGKKTVVVSGVHTHELFMDDTDNLYGEHLWYNGEKADTWGHYVWKLSPAGKLDRIKPSTTGIPNDYSFVRDKNGNMYWADRTDKCQKVIRKNKDGSLTKMGDACMENIRWMTCTPEGVVYIVDLHDIKKMDLHGHIITLTEDVPGKKILSLFVDPTHFLSGISVDSHENVYVADYSAKQVKKITPSKQVSVLAETNTPWSPSGSLLAPNGDFWILENSITNHVRVECITKDGKRIIY